MDSFVHDYSLTASIVGGAAALVAVLLGVLLSRLHRTTVIEAEAGLAVLHTLKWGDLAHYMIEAFRTRGFDATDSERKPGDGGFDLLLLRGHDRHLLQCKHGGAYRVGERPVSDLIGLMQSQDAIGGILATTGRFGADAQRAARGRDVTLLEGIALWTLLKPHLPDALLEQAREGVTAIRRRKAGRVLLATLATGVAFYVAAWYSLLPRPVAPVDVVVVTPKVAAVAPAEPLLRRPSPQELSATQQRERRLEAIEEIAAIGGVVSVDWQSKSTVAVALRADAESTPAVLDGICAVLGHYEELRYSRVQVRPFDTDKNTESRVRWHVCGD